ncbi:hypothetical protein AAGS61_10575 [Lysinibacillus sp. KU-BSD001]|uniref:hypothetical protein n=1 Tax=Lysinibacillus sp. KU-BSD001 TaxID=3141328 RepID=UPI0036E80509
MNRDSYIFPYFLKTDFNDIEQIIELVNIIPSANEPFSADVLYELLYKTLPSEKQKEYSITSTPQNLRKIMLEQKNVLKKITHEVNEIIKKYNASLNNVIELGNLNARIEKEIKNADIKIANNIQRVRQYSFFNLKANNIREYFYINLVFCMDPKEEFYICTYCDRWVYKPKQKQISTFNKTGTILHPECRENRKKQKYLERRNRK